MSADQRGKNMVELGFLPSPLMFVGNLSGSYFRRDFQPSDSQRVEKLKLE
jgi:hypothetical protein